MKSLAGEFLRYGLASAVAFAVDAGLLWLLVASGTMHYLAAATLAFCAGALVAYALSVRLVFAHRRLDSRAAELNLFLLIGLLGLGINNLVIWLGVEFAGAAPVAAKFAASAITLTVNFTLRRMALFTPRSAAVSSPAEGSRCLESH
jgi:putative flippase GtrA